MKKKTNIINVSLPIFGVKRNDPTVVSYKTDLDNTWKYVHVEWYGVDPDRKGNDFLYVYEKEKDSSGFRGALLTSEHLRK